MIPDLYDGLAWNMPVEFIGQFPTIPLHRRDFPRSCVRAEAGDGRDAVRVGLGVLLRCRCCWWRC